MDHLWIIGFAAAICAVLVPLLWGVWGTELRIWLIPAMDIQTEAKALVRSFGHAARREAMKRSLDAWSRSEPLEAGRWDRVVVALHEASSDRASLS